MDFQQFAHLPLWQLEWWKEVFLFQGIALVCALLFAFISALFLRRQPRMGRYARFLFPLCALFFLGLSFLILQKIQKPFSLVEVLFYLFFAFIFVRAVVWMMRYAFPHNAFLSASEKIIVFSMWLWVALFITGIAPILAESLDSIALSVGENRFSLWRFINGVLMVFLTLVVSLCFSALLEKRLMGFKTWDMSARIVGARVVKAFFWVVAGLVSLSILGINMTALSVFTGALGVGLGFGFQKIASNYVSGFIILLERSIQIGNLVSVNGLTGKVTHITTRFTVLKTANGEEIIIPNEILVSNIVQNKTLSDSLLKVSVEVGIAYGSDVDLASRLMAEAALKESRVLKTPEPLVLLSNFGESAIVLNLSFWINDPENGTAVLSSNINHHIWQSFQKNGVAMPFPQREVRILKEEKK